MCQGGWITEKRNGQLLSEATELQMHSDLAAIVVTGVPILKASQYTVRLDNHNLVEIMMLFTLSTEDFEIKLS